MTGVTPHDVRFSRLDEVNASDAEYLNREIERIRDDLDEDRILFDEISVKRDKNFEETESWWGEIRGYVCSQLESREVEVTLKYEVLE